MGKKQITINDDVFLEQDAGEFDGSPSLKLYFAGCVAEIEGTELTEREKYLFKKGVFAERERAWDVIPEGSLSFKEFERYGIFPHKNKTLGKGKE